MKKDNTTQRKSIKKRITILLVFTLGGIFLLLVIGFILLTNPVSQTYIAQMVAKKLSADLNTTITINKIKLTSFKDFSIKGLIVMDKENDTLCHIKQLDISLKERNTETRIIHLRSLLLVDSYFNIVKYKDQYGVNLQFIIDHFSSETDDTTKASYQIICDRITLKNDRLFYTDHEKEYPEAPMDYAALKMEHISMIGSDLIFANDTLNVHIDHLEGSEKSGAVIKRLSTDFTFNGYYAKGAQTYLEFNNSFIEGDLEFFFDDGMDDIQYFNDSVIIDASLQPSKLLLSDLKYFSPVMEDMDNEFRFSSDVKGRIKDFKAKNLKVYFDQNTYLLGKANITGLPDIKETFSHISIEEFITNTSDFRKFALPGNERISIPETLNKFGKIKITGSFTGFYNDFVSYAHFNTKLGAFSTDLKLKVNNQDTIEYSGGLSTFNFDLGKFLDLDNILGEINSTTQISGSGFNLDDLNLDIDGTFQTVSINNELINNINLEGNFSQKKFTGFLDVSDDIAELDFDGIIDFQNTVPRYNFTSSINYINLDKLNLVDDSTCIFSGDIDINMIGSKADELQGILKLKSPALTYKSKAYQFEDLSLSITNQSKDFRVIRLFSGIADAYLEGKVNLENLYGSSLHFANQYFDTLISDQLFINPYINEQDFVFDVKTKNTKNITKIFSGTDISASDLSLHGEFNDLANYILIEASCKEIFVHNQILKNWEMLISNTDDSLIFASSSKNFQLSDTIELDNLFFKSSFQKNTFNYHTGFGIVNSDRNDYARINGNINFHSSTNISNKFRNSLIQLDGSIWNISENNRIAIDTSSISFNNLAFSNNDQLLLLEGEISEAKKDTLRSKFENFKFSNFDLFLKPYNLDFDGIISGAVNLTGLYDTANYLTNLYIDKLFLNKENLGAANINTIWDKKDKTLFLNADITYSGNMASKKTLLLNGKYKPSSKLENFDINLQLDNYSLKTLSPFVSDFSSNIKGLASGKLNLYGTLSEPYLTGRLDIKRGQMYIDYLNCNYYFADPIFFSKDKIYFDTITIYDTLSNTALLKGNISHNYLKNWSFDLNIKTDKLVGMNTTAAQNDMYFGQAIVRGKIKIHGPVEQLVLDIDVAPEKGSDITIPISTATELVNNDYIVFVNKQIDTIPSQPSNNATEEYIEILTKLAVNENAMVQLNMPYEMGKITGRGSGDLEINMNPRGEIDMRGTYSINEGTYYMTLQNIINRNFKIQPGSELVWNGDPYNAQINIEAIYNLKTSLGIYGPEADSAVKVPVDCIIRLKNDLTKPDIYFSIDFPTLEENTKQIVYSKLDTTDQSYMNKQIVSLLVLNSFNENLNYGSSINFNTFSIFTNQVNNWLSQISNDFDIGINYRPGDAITKDEVGVALSTQLFNDRVSINGNVDLKGSESQETTNSIVGEVDVEVKITPNGKLKAKFFNQSNNDYLMENYTPYTQGVGLFYTHEFEKFSEIFNKKK